MECCIHQTLVVIFTTKKHTIYYMSTIDYLLWKIYYIDNITLPVKFLTNSKLIIIFIAHTWNAEMLNSIKICFLFEKVYLLSSRQWITFAKSVQSKLLKSRHPNQSSIKTCKIIALAFTSYRVNNLWFSFIEVKRRIIIIWYRKVLMLLSYQTNAHWQ